MFKNSRFVLGKMFFMLMLFLAPMMMQFAHHHPEKHDHCCTTETNTTDSSIKELCLVCDYHFMPATVAQKLNITFYSNALFISLQSIVEQSKASESRLFQLRAPPVV